MKITTLGLIILFVNIGMFNYKPVIQFRIIIYVIVIIGLLFFTVYLFKELCS